MAAVAIVAGLLPILWRTGAGSEIIQRIALPMTGGTISSTLLTLIVILAILGLVKGVPLASETDARSGRCDHVCINRGASCTSGTLR
jgi:Cu(I)/Ag(I) efflux system membrane protein CusA/SilA